MNSQCFLDSSPNIIDYYSNVYGNCIVIGDFNLEPSQVSLEKFMETHNYFKLIKNNIYFKGPRSLQKKYGFQGTFSFETGFSDLINSILKSIFEKEEPKQVIYRN